MFNIVTNKFSSTLKLLRNKRNITLELLGTELGVSKQSVNRWELGQREPNIDTLIALANYFDVSLDYLVGLSDNPKRN